MTDDSRTNPERPTGDARARPQTGDGRSSDPEERLGDPDRTRDRSDRARRKDPPRTTHGWLTMPEFGAAGSGGAEYEQGPETD